MTQRTGGRLRAGASDPTTIAANEPALLEVRALDLSYGQVQVLFGVDVQVRRGEVLALLGTNGAGKSTLLRAITGLSSADRGEIHFDGAWIHNETPAKRLRRGIVAVPGGKATFPTLSVLENLRARAYRLPRRQADAKVTGALELFPRLAERRDQAAGSLSGGEQQMLALAGAIMLDPTLLLIDELSLGLAPVVVQRLLETVAELKDRGITMVIVEQSINVALSLAERAIFMEKGTVRFEGRTAELLERGDLIRAVFLGADAG